MQGGRKHLKLGGHDILRALFLKKKGAFFKVKRALLSLLQNLGGACAPSSYVYEEMKYPCALFSARKFFTV